MERKFSVSAYLSHLARELINNFSLAGGATTPVLVGSAKEKATRQKLEKLLPPMIGVGTGCIIDSFGGTSKQMDIILYEKEFCPIFSINDTPETTYYPCEGVIAIGEIKSTLNTAELEDIFAKVESVKSLKRFAEPEASVLFKGKKIVPFRCFGNAGSFECTEDEEFNQDAKWTDQIFCFALCGELGVQPQTILNKFVELSGDYPKNKLINLMSILNYGLLLHTDIEKLQVRYCNEGQANGISLIPKSDGNFQYLTRTLIDISRISRTPHIKAFSRYFDSEGSGYISLEELLKGYHAKI